MDKTYIVAFACEDHSGELHFINLHEPVEYNTITFQEDCIISGNSIIAYSWYKSITVCTEETMELFRRNLQIAI